MEQTIRSFFLFPPFLHTQRLSGVYCSRMFYAYTKTEEVGREFPLSSKTVQHSTYCATGCFFSLNNMSKTFPISAHTFVAHFSKNNIVVHFIERYHGPFIHFIINDCYGMSDSSQLKNNACTCSSMSLRQISPRQSQRQNCKVSN